MNSFCTQKPHASFFRFLFSVGLAALFAAGCDDHKAELEKLRQENQELQQAQAQHQELIANKDTQIEQLRKATEDLPRLRNDYVQLQRVKKEAQQASNLVAQLQGEVAQLRGAQQQANATMTQLQIKMQADKVAQVCIANLKQLDGAILQWALENGKPKGSAPTDLELFGPERYIKVKPACPGNGAYTLGTVGAKPTCTIPGHAF